MKIFLQYDYEMMRMKKIIIGVIVAGTIIAMVMCYNNEKPFDDKNGSLCPRCKSDSIATIMYGLLRENPDSFQEEMRKRRMVAGGCVVGPEKYSCYNCGYRWPRYFSE